MYNCIIFNFIAKMVEEKEIQTLIFMDFEVAGGWLENEIVDEIQMDAGLDADLSQLLAKFVASDIDMSRVPRIAEMSFITVPRELFKHAAENMEFSLARLDEDVKADVRTNRFTCQLNPELSEEQWAGYDRTNASRRLRRFDLELKNIFKKEWPIVQIILRNCAKPACLIAHNGHQYDFRILLHELRRTNMQNSCSIPDGVYFADSLKAFRSIERRFHQTMRIAVENGNLSDRLPSESVIADVEIIEIDDKSSAKRKKIPFEYLPADHLYHHIQRTERCVAKKRRVPPNIFQRDESEQRWRFSEHASKRSLEGCGRYKLNEMYKQLIGDKFRAHYAEEDSEALLQVSLAYGNDFLEYIDAHHAMFPGQEGRNERSARRLY